MKTIFKIIVLFLAISHQLPCLWAQPVLTSNNHFPISEGLRYTRYKCDTTNILPGTGGASMLWDFGDMAFAPTFIDAGTYVLPSMTQYSGFFPGATLAEIFSSNQTFYYLNNTDSLSLLGYMTVSGASLNQLNYTNPLVLMQYPLAYGSAFVDTATRVYSNITGTVVNHVEADGYGRLILPNGVFDDVLRVHSQIEFDDVAATGQFFNLTDDIYEWYDGVHHKPLLTIRLRNVNNNGTLSSTKLIDMADVIAPISLADAYGYTYQRVDSSPTTSCAFRDISQIGTLVSDLVDDNVAENFLLGFPFQYYWSSYDRLNIGSNGYLIMGDGSFNIASSSGNFPRMPTADANNSIIAPLLCDLNFDGTDNPGKAYFYSNGIDTCIVMFKNVPFWTNANASGFSGSNTFEVILTAADSSITFIYENLSPRTDMNVSYQTSIAPVVTGIENSNGTIGLQMALSSMSQDSSCYRFTPPAVPLIDVIDVYPQWNENEQNGAVFLLQNDVVNLTARIKNGGSTDIDAPITVVSTIIDSEGNNFGDPLTTSFSGLLQGATQDVITWEGFPAIEGYYTYLVTANTVNDINPANNDNTSELIVIDTTATGEMSLSYVNEPLATQNTLSWAGGGDFADGAGIYIKPPFYPARIESVDYFVVPPAGASVIGSGFRAQIRDDDGTDASTGSVLFETDVPASAISGGGWHSVVAGNDTITEGGFYAAWLMEGNGIALATDRQAPFSRRNYEILNHTWSPFRNNEAEDVYIRVKMKTIHLPPIDTTVIDTTVVDTTGTDTTVIDTTVFIRHFHRSPFAQLAAPQPNPAHGMVALLYYLPKRVGTVTLSVYDVLGRKRLERRHLANDMGEHRVMLDIDGFPPGQYLYTLQTDDVSITRKLMIDK